MRELSCGGAVASARQGLARRWRCGSVRRDPRPARELQPRLLPRPPSQPPVGTTKGLRPAFPQLTGPSLGGGWGIRTPEGLRPALSPSGPRGLWDGSQGCVCAGQRVAGMLVEASRSGRMERDCYQNCYQGRPSRDPSGSAVTEDVDADDGDLTSRITEEGTAPRFVDSPDRVIQAA